MLRVTCCFSARPKSLGSSQTDSIQKNTRWSRNASPSVWQDWLTDHASISHGYSDTVLSASIPDSSPASSRFRKAVENYEKSLSSKEVAYIALLNHSSHHDLVSYTRALQQDYEANIPKLYSGINSIFEKILGFSSVIDVIAQVQSPSCIIWGKCPLATKFWLTRKADILFLGSIKLILEVHLP